MDSANTSRRIIALDIGRKTGWAIWDGNAVHYGTQILCTEAEVTEMHKSGADRDFDIRIPRLREWLLGQVDSYGIREIFFEDVQFYSYRQQMQLWGSARGCIWTIPGVSFRAVDVKKIKAFACHGGADKTQMAAAAGRIQWDCPVNAVGKIDDNSLDALHLLRYSLASHEHNDHRGILPKVRPGRGRRR